MTEPLGQLGLQDDVDPKVDLPDELELLEVIDEDSFVLK